MILVNLLSMSSRKKKDLDYEPTEPLPKRKKLVNENIYSKEESETFLNQNQSEIWQLQSMGLKPKAIAQTLCTNHGLKKESVTPKQVSNWIQYKKRSGQHKTRPVSINNIRPDLSDSCMYKCDNDGDGDGDDNDEDGIDLY